MPSLFSREREPTATPVKELSVAKLRSLFPRRRRSDVNLAEPKRLFNRRSVLDFRSSRLDLGATEHTEVEDKPNNRIEATVLDTKTSRASSPPADLHLEQQSVTPAVADPESSPEAQSHPDIEPPLPPPLNDALSPPVQRIPSSTSRPSLVVETDLRPHHHDAHEVFETPATSPRTVEVFTTPPKTPRDAAGVSEAMISPLTESPAREVHTELGAPLGECRRANSHEVNGTANALLLEHTEEGRRVSDPPPKRRASAISTDSIIGSPRRMSAVLHSPPMPQPIANLPGFSPGPSTPGWGALALEGGPRSPALSRQNSRQASQPGAGFPFFSATPAVTSPQGDKTMSDAEARKATKTMPVMLRMPSQPAPAGADEDDDDEEDLDDDDDMTSEEAGPSTAPPLISEPLQPPAARKGSTTMMEPLIEDPASRRQSVDLTTPSRGYFESRGLRLHTGSPGGQEMTPSSGIDDGSFVESEGDSASMDETPVSALQTPSSPVRPGLYSHVSQSMVNLPTPSSRIVPRARDADLSRIPETPVAAPAVETWALPPPTPSGISSHLWAEPRSPPPLKRRLSAGDADPPPPKYQVSALMHEGPAPKPREEEGREHLPPYWCGVHIEGTLARKMEFTSPGVQARDRGWKKHYFVLHGTALFVYKFDPTKVPLRQGEPYLTCDRRESEQFLHVHLAPENHRASISSHTATITPKAGPGARRATINLDNIQRGPISGVLASARRGTIGSVTPTRRQSTPESDGKIPELFQPTSSNRRQSSGADSVASSTASAPIASHLPFAHNHMVHVYSLHGAESGLAADYKKRLHCVRVRAEGQQFMLQTDTARQCVQWIEAFQAATNVAMDLDVRPMPVQQTLPRRRRRPGARRPATATVAEPAAAAASTAATAGETTAFDDTPEGNAAAVEAAERTAREARERERDRMLAEDQAAESHGSFRT